MAIYLNRNDIEAEFDATHLARFLDDSGDGAEDEGLFNSLADAVDNEILGIIAALPVAIVTNLQSYLRYAAKVLFCDMAYRRKGVANGDNPHSKIAETVRERLKDIQNGTLNFAQLKTLSFIVPSNSWNPFATTFSTISQTASATLPSYSTSSGDLILTATDGRQYKMVVSHANGAVVHSWEEVV